MSDATSKKGSYDLSNLFVLPTQQKKRGLDRPRNSGWEEERDTEVANSTEGSKAMKNPSKSKIAPEKTTALQKSSHHQRAEEIVEKRSLTNISPSVEVNEETVDSHQLPVPNPAMSKEDLLLAIKSQLANLREKSQRIKYFVEEMVNSCPLDQDE